MAESESPTRYEQARALAPTAFRRLLGVRPETFALMLLARQERERAKGKSGRPSKLPLEDQLLLALEFWREYPAEAAAPGAAEAAAPGAALFQLAHRFGVHESTAQRTVERVEPALLESGRFRLPSKRKLLEPGGEVAFEVVVVDVTESRIEKPNKSSGAYRVRAGFASTVASANGTA